MENNNQYVYEGNKNDELIAEGEYEAYIEKMEECVTPNGKRYLKIQFKLRDDIEQPYARRCIWESIWESKENPNVYNPKRINQLLGTQHVVEGTVFENTKAVIDFMYGKFLGVKIGIEFDTYQAKNVNVVRFYRSTNAKPQTLNTQETKQDTQNVSKIVEDDFDF